MVVRKNCVERLLISFSRLNKKGQQSSFGMSFGMLFSLFLIIIFIGMAFIVIRMFLDFSGTSNLGQFYVDLQDEVNSAWRSSETVRTFDLDLPSDITHICFSDLSAPVTGSKDMFDMIQNNMYLDVNTFLIPPGSAGDLDIKQIEHLDIAKITASSNPYCVSGKSKLIISKGVRDRLVSIK
jgi:hypothetical protein